MSIIQEKYGSKEEQCRLFPTRRIAEHCLSFLQAGSVNSARVLSILICPKPDEHNGSRLSVLENEDGQLSCNSESTTVHALFHPADGASLAGQFWLFTGTGISSRRAEYYLSMLGEDIPASLWSKPNSETLLTDGPLAKQILRQRIASALCREGPVRQEWLNSQTGVLTVSEDDVYLFPTGMAAVWNAHHLALGVRPAGKTACFGLVFKCQVFC
jgi:cystathionine gamma-synthase